MPSVFYQANDETCVYGGIWAKTPFYAWNVFGIAEEKDDNDAATTTCSSVIELQLSELVRLMLPLPSKYNDTPEYKNNNKAIFSSPTIFMFGHVIEDSNIRKETIPIPLQNLLSLDYLHANTRLIPLERYKTFSPFYEEYNADTGHWECLRRCLLMHANGMANKLVTDHNPKNIRIVIRMEITLPRACDDEQQFGMRMTEEFIKLSLESAPPDCNQDLKIKEFDTVENLEQDTCPICLNKLLVGVHLQMLHCSHVFHKKCAAGWLLNHDTCPNCRFPVPEIFYQSKG